MNARLLMKFVVVLAVLLFMVMMGMSNGDPVRFKLTPLSYESEPIKSAFMYFIFFAVGAFTGLVLAVGSGGKLVLFERQVSRRPVRRPDRVRSTPRRRPRAADSTERHEKLCRPADRNRRAQANLRGRRTRSAARLAPVRTPREGPPLDRRRGRRDHGIQPPRPRAVADHAAAVKPQSAFYEALGWEGVRALAGTVRAAHDCGLLVIADVKRGDIGSTAEAYAQGHLDLLQADAVTVNPYLGMDGIAPFLKRARDGKGNFRPRQDLEPVLGRAAGPRRVRREAVRESRRARRALGRRLPRANPATAPSARSSAPRSRPPPRSCAG